MVVATALTFNDVQTTGRLSEVTRAALDVMWKTQREDGSWKWPMCGWPPMESDEHFGVTLAAIAVGIAPEGYAETKPALIGLQRIRNYLDANPPLSLHHRAMLAWASKRVDGLMSEDQRMETHDELLSLQRPRWRLVHARFIGGFK